MDKKEIIKALNILKKEPIEEYWKPKNIGVCTAQRIESHQVSCPMYLIGQHDGLQDMYCYGIGCIYLQVGRVPNTHWMNESGHTYMLWKD